MAARNGGVYPDADGAEMTSPTIVPFSVFRFNMNGTDFRFVVSYETNSRDMIKLKGLH